MVASGKKGPWRGRPAAAGCGALALAVVSRLTPLVRRGVLEARLLRVLESGSKDLEAVEQLISLGSARVVPHLLRIEDEKYFGSLPMHGQRYQAWQRAFPSIYEKRPRETMNIL